MASKSENSEIAVLQTQMKQVQDDIGEIKVSISSISDKLDGSFVTRSEFDAHRKNQWLERILTVLITAVIMGLAGFFFGNINK